MPMTFKIKKEKDLSVSVTLDLVKLRLSQFARLRKKQ